MKKKTREWVQSEQEEESGEVKDGETKSKRVYVCFSRVWSLSCSFIPLTAMSNTRSLAVLSAAPRYQPQVRR